MKGFFFFGGGDVASILMLLSLRFMEMTAVSFIFHSLDLITVWIHGLCGAPVLIELVL